MTFGAPTRDELVALEAKYAQLEALRRARERGEPIPERAVFKALAERFPGALRELDLLPMDIIEMRRQQLGIAVAGFGAQGAEGDPKPQMLQEGLVEPWMAWMVAYHALLRAALWIKMRTAKRPDVTNDRRAFLVRGVADEFGFGVDEQFVVDVARPRAGRINAVVLGRLGTMFGVSVGEIQRGLFGVSRCNSRVVRVRSGDDADDGELA